MLTFDRSKVIKDLAEGNVLVPHLDRAFQTFDDPWTFDYTAKEHDDAWHPSGDCLPLASRLYAKAKGAADDPVSGSLRKSFMVGHYWHQLLQHIVLTKLGFCDAEHIERVGKHGWGTTPHGAFYAPHHWVKGAGDFAPLTTPRWEGIVDIKTMSSRQFKQPTLPEWAEFKYTCQMNIYMSLFDQEQALILAVNKDAPHDFKEFPFVRDQPLIDAILDKWMFVSHCLDADYEPTSEDDRDFALPGQEIA